MYDRGQNVDINRYAAISGEFASLILAVVMFLLTIPM